MSDNANAPAGNEAGEGQQQNSEQTENTGGTALDALPAEFSWVRDEVTKARQEAAKYRTRAREFADDAVYEAAKQAMTELEQRKEAEKTELQKLQEQAEAFKADAEKHATELARERAARKHSLPDEAVEFLTGTAEEIEQKAERLAQLTAQPGGLRPDPSQGSANGGGAPATTADQFANALNAFLS